MFFPLSRLRRQLSQRESQVPRVVHYTERWIEVPLFSVRRLTNTDPWRGVRKTVNGRMRSVSLCYGTAAGSLLGSPSGRAVTEGD